MERGPLSTTDLPGGEDGGPKLLRVLCHNKRVENYPFPSVSLLNGRRPDPCDAEADSLVKKLLLYAPEWICLWWIAAAHAPSTAEASIAVPFDAGRLASAFAPPSTICTTSAAAGVTADRSTRRLQKPLVPTDAFLNLPSAEWISGPTNRRQAALSSPIRSRYGGVLPSGCFVFARQGLLLQAYRLLAGRSNR
jgi:hypothetical protein